MRRDIELRPLGLVLGAAMLFGCGGGGHTSTGMDAGSPPDGAVDGGGSSMDAGDAGPTVAIVPGATGFVAYGQLRIGFDGPVDPNQLTVTLSPQRPSTLSSVGITAVDATTVDVALSTYHLPIDYTVSVTIAGMGTVQYVIPGAGNGSRVAFVSEGQGVGDLSTWTDAGGAQGVAAGDAVCQAEADRAGLEGTFVAYLSEAGTVDAACRLLGSDALVANGCGLGAQVPADDAPILDTAGRPFLGGVDALRQQAWDAPVRLLATGQPAPSGSFAWTGTSADGSGASPTCQDWTSASNSDSGFSAAFVQELVPRATNVLPCDLAGLSWTAHLLCFQTGGPFFGPATLNQHSGKLAFITSTDVNANLGGPAGGDAACQAAASTAGLSGTFVAWLSDGTDDAYCRLAGGTGTRASGCGLASIPPGGPWVRLDGFPVADNLAALTDGEIDYPILIDETGARVPLNTHAFTGTDPDGTRRTPALDCSGWTSATGTGSGGLCSATARSWTQYFSGPCTGAARLYCFER